MEVELEADRLLIDIKREQKYVDALRLQVRIDTRALKQHMAVLRRLKARAKTAKRTYQEYPRYQRPWINTEVGIEWVSFNNAVRYGVTLEGDGWHFVFGRNRNTVVEHATFSFDLELDVRMRELLRSYVSHAKITKRGAEIMCSDVKGVLSLAQMIAKPSRIVLRTAVTSQAILSHTRIYTTASTANIRFARVIGEQHG